MQATGFCIFKMFTAQFTTNILTKYLFLDFPYKKICLHLTSIYTAIKYNSCLNKCDIFSKLLTAKLTTLRLTINIIQHKNNTLFCLLEFSPVNFLPYTSVQQMYHLTF